MGASTSKFISFLNLTMIYKNTVLRNLEPFMYINHFGNLKASNVDAIIDRAIIFSTRKLNYGLTNDTQFYLLSVDRNTATLLKSQTASKLKPQKSTVYKLAEILTSS